MYIAKKNLKKVVDEKILVIDGMRCEGCASAVSDALNRIDHISAEVDLKKKTATVRMEEPVGDLVLTRAVSKAGYTVTDIR
jgi:copper chaperone CopZ